MSWHQLARDKKLVSHSYDAFRPVGHHEVIPSREDDSRYEDAYFVSRTALDDEYEATLRELAAPRDDFDAWCSEHRRLRHNCWPHGHRCGLPSDEAEATLDAEALALVRELSEAAILAFEPDDEWVEEDFEDIMRFRDELEAWAERRLP